MTVHHPGEEGADGHGWSSSGLTKRWPRASHACSWHPRSPRGKGSQDLPNLQTRTQSSQVAKPPRLRKTQASFSPGAGGQGGAGAGPLGAASRAVAGFPGQRRTQGRTGVRLTPGDRGRSLSSRCSGVPTEGRGAGGRGAPSGGGRGEGCAGHSAPTAVCRPDQSDWEADNLCRTPSPRLCEVGGTPRVQK